MKPALQRFFYMLSKARAPVSQKEIVQAAGLSQAMVSRYCRDSIKAGLLYGTQQGATGVGRPTTLYSLRRDRCLVLAVHLPRGRIEMSLLDFNGNPARIGRETAPIVRRGLTYDKRLGPSAEIAEVLSRICLYLKRWCGTGTYHDRLFQIAVIDNRNVLGPDGLKLMAEVLQAETRIRSAVMDYPEALAFHALDMLPNLSGHKLFCAWFGGIDLVQRHYETGWPGGQLLEAISGARNRLSDAGTEIRNGEVIRYHYYQMPEWVRDGSIPLGSSNAAKLEQMIKRLAAELFPYSLDFVFDDDPVAGVIGGVWRKAVVEGVASELQRIHAARSPRKSAFLCLPVALDADELLFFTGRVAIARALYQE